MPVCEEQETEGRSRGRGHEQQVCGTKMNIAVLVTESGQRRERPGPWLCLVPEHRNGGTASARREQEKCRSAMSRSWR